MTSILSTPGKYRSRKDLSASSIPALVSLEEESSPATLITLNSNGNGIVVMNDQLNINNGIPTKPPRRSSLGIGLLGARHNNGQDKNNKRRSSIAVAFLGGRRDSKSNHNYTINTIPEKYHKTTESDNENDSPNLLSVPSIEMNGDYANGATHDKDKKRRRSSSWQTKLERRRRKGMASALDDEIQIDFNVTPIDALKYGREKRHSWWNIFVPDNLKQRTRRASQDVILSKSTDNLTPYRRSKSRSVDHGLAAPFDLDSLRSKVEGRFESIDRLSKDGEKKRSMPVIPTMSYTVGDRDTLTSVAARFDTTPSELTHLNRLTSSFIYSGQQILVPDKTIKDSDVGDWEGSEHSSNSPTDRYRQKDSHEDLSQDEKNLLEGLRPGSPRPGHIERVGSPHNQSGGVGEFALGIIDPDDPVTIQRFLKINVRHITDGQGVVGGVLLVTPNAVMFDPNVSDPLVIEHGPESYGVIAPMEFIVNAAIFNDIAHMRVNGAIGGNNSTEKAEIYHPIPTQPCSRCDTHSPAKDSLLVKDENFPELLGDDQESLCSSNERECDAHPKVFDRDSITSNNLQRLHEDSTESGGSLEKPSSTEPPYDRDSHSHTPNSLDGNNVQDSLLTTKDSKTDRNDKTDKTNNLEEPSMKSLEERRRSLLDQHWAIPSKDRSLDEEEESNNEVSGGNRNIVHQHVPVIDGAEDGGILVKLSCHDSGIDIRDPNSLPGAPVVPQIPAKKIYSDADIVLSSDWVPPLTIAPTHFTESSPKNTSAASAQQAMQAQNNEQGGRKKTSSVSFSVDEHEQQILNVQLTDKVGETKKNKMLKRLSYPLAWVEGLTGDGSSKSDSIESAPNTGDSNQSVFSKVFSRRSSIGTFIRTHPSSESGNSQSSGGKQKQAPPKLDYRSMVSIDDMPTLFVSFDKLIPRPARACPDPPMYLRLRMGRQIGKTTPLPTTVMSYGKNKLRPEYWFSIPKNKVDELYRFLNSWVQHIYGELDEDAIASRGFELIQCDTEWIHKGSPTKEGRSASDGEITEYTRESWEVLSMSTDDYRKAALFAPGSFDQDFQIPDLVGQTEILSEEHREKLCAHLPARAEGYSWSLVFSTSLHGFSLNSLYRKMHKLESPILIVIEDTDHNVFGALTSCSLHVSDHFYGTGESLLYKFNPHFKVFHWSGENLYFIKGNPESLAIGAGDGKFGLWLDGDLNQGRSQHCSTYSNEPLAPQEDFVIKTLECWAFV